MKKQENKANTGGRMISALLLTALCIVPARYASADSPADNTDALTITVTPLYDFGVDITTTAAAMDLGSVNLYASTFTVLPATVTFQGNKAGQELDLSASLTGGWKFDVSPSTWASSGEKDALAVYALFTSTTLAAAPAGDDFANGTADAAFAADAQTFPGTRVGGSPGNGSKFEKQGAGGADMDSRNPGDMSLLWFLLRLPNQTSVTIPQSVTVTLTATIDNL